MYAAGALEAVGAQRFIERVVAVRRNEYFPAGDAHYYGRVVKIARRSAELYDIAYFEFIGRNFFGKRTYALVLR